MLGAEIALVSGAAVAAGAFFSPRAKKPEAAPKKEPTFSGVQSLLAENIARIKSRRRGDPALATLAAANARGPSLLVGLSIRPHTVQIPIFAHGDFCGLCVLLPAPGEVCGEEGLLVTKVHANLWAESCGAGPGARLVRLDGIVCAGLSAEVIKERAAAAPRPLWLELSMRKRTTFGQPATGKKIPAGGTHLLL